MRILSVVAVSLSMVSAFAGPIADAELTLAKRAQPSGIDVSSYQPDVDWKKVKANGISFVYIKATEGTS